jgi:UDP-N-acetylglucosamine--N-acetylmuramyl-(pentapeptide) pyrophosphoryl-undecaprenol N-acetylglucosamine transferase
VCCQFEATRAAAAKRLGLDPVKNTLTITGASQGATTINEAMPPTLAGMNLPGWQILHLSGRSNADGVREAYRSHNLVAQVIDFTPAMADVWAATDLAVSRAGASSCAELCVCGVPSVLLPYPYHKDQHQRFNAKVLADANAAVLLEDFKDAAKNTQSLRPVLQELLHDAVKRKAMADAAKQLGRPDAAEAVGKVVVELAG